MTSLQLNDFRQLVLFFSSSSSSSPIIVDDEWAERIEIYTYINVYIYTYMCMYAKDAAQVIQRNDTIFGS